MTRLKDIVWQKFNLLTIIKYVGNKKYGCFFLCKCDCGKEKEIQGSLVKRGKVISCGCVRNGKASARLSKHGESKTKLYKVWSHMLQRCHLPKDMGYKNYGGRGITVCDRWRSNFLYFKEDMNETFSPGLELDRIENSKGYYKDNCRWATSKQNNNNKRTNCYLEINGVTKTAMEWSEIHGLNSRCISNRVRAGFLGETALFGIQYLKRLSKHL